MNSLKAASFCEGLASCLLLSFLPLHVRALGEDSYFVASLLLALPALSIFAMSNFWGAFVDTTGSFRLTERIGLLGYTFCLAALCAVRGSIGAIAVVVGFSILYSAARPTFLSHATLLEERAKAKAISCILLFQSVGWLVSSVVFGLLYDRQNPWSPMTMSLILGVPALASLVMAVIMPRMKVDFDPVDDTDPVADPDPVADFDPAVKRISFRGALRQGLFRLLIGDLGRVYKTPELFRLCVLVFLMSVANWAFFGMFSFIFTEEVGGEELGLGLTLAASTAIATVVFAFAGRLIDRFGGRAGLFLSILLYIFVYSSISFATTPWLVILLFIVPVYPVFLVSATALAAEATRSEQRAGGVGVMSGVFSLSMAAGSVLGGLIGDHFGLRAIVVTSACLSCLCLVVFFLFVGFKRVRPAQEREGS